jgi:Mrp family chromosome partitioning ATPase
MASVLPAGLLEAARLLRANLKPGDVNTAPPPLMVLGTTSDAGCARVAAGLAAVLAEEGKQTLLVDADIRNPSLHEVFRVSASPGLAEALEADVSVVLPTPVDRALSFLPAGRSSRSAGELLRLPRATDIATGLAARFAAVVYAGSGDPSYPDAMFLAARVVHAAVLVIRLGRDSADDVRRVKAPLEDSGVAILGFALLDNRNSLWVPKLAWTPWGRNGIDAAATLTPARSAVRG